MRRVKVLLVTALLATSGAAFADTAKVQREPGKLDREARVYVMDKDAPSVDKTVTLAARPRTSLKNK